MKSKLHSKDLRGLSYEELVNLLSDYSPNVIEELFYTWEFWARPNQLEPEGFKDASKDYWIFNAGRGSGKTRAGAEWVRHRVRSGDKRIACIAPTKGDVRRVMVEGESGLLSVCWNKDHTYRGEFIGKPTWYPTNNQLIWANGAKAEFFSAEDPERLRGPQFEAAWADELAAWRNLQEVWDMLQFCMRLGFHPKTMVTTTPKPRKLIRELLQHPRSVVSTGSTYDNADNLASSYLEAVRSTYEGTRLGRQELYAELLDEASGALWSRKLLEQCEIDDVQLPEQYTRLVVAVDPATTANEESDMTGIIVAGLDVNGTAYVLEDATLRGTPQEWAEKVVSLYYKYDADRVVAERNQGGEMVRHTIHTVDDSVPVRMVHASRGKMARAEPISALYERGKVKHTRNLDQLEDQMVSWEPLGSIGSPDRLDALVWALTDLMLKGFLKPTLKIAYSPASGVKL